MEGVMEQPVENDLSYSRADEQGPEQPRQDDAVRGLSDLYSPDSEQVRTSSSVADILDVLLDLGSVSQDQYQQIRQSQSTQPGGQIESIIIESDLVSHDELLKAKAQIYGLEFTAIDTESIDRSLMDQMSIDLDFVRSNRICPIRIEDGSVIAASSDPGNIFAIEDFKRRTSMEVRIVVCSADDIESVCEMLTEDTIDYDVDDIINDMDEVEVIEDEQKDFEDLERMAGQSPVIKFVNYLIGNAITSGASDIHIEPRDKQAKVRYRIDGVLFETTNCPAKMHPAMVSRIKIMANLDISERRLPQDGKVSVIVGHRAIDLRISILPTNRGEKVVIRILDSKSIMRGMEELGMSEHTLNEFRKQIVLPNGIFLVTGPTGSGKSTTLYSALSQMDGEKMNISTVEDPVEYELDFCNQVQVIDRIGLDFASALRSLLRQDPDIIMIGEIRDQETAKIAVQAALTGHLVLSTLHTNDASSSVTRLVDIGVDPYLIAASLNGVLAQRLVRRICDNCKEQYHLPEAYKPYADQFNIGYDELYHGVGCDECRNSGYAGRVGIYEMLTVNDAFRGIINRDCSVASMRRVFREQNCPTLFSDGMNKVKLSQTTIEEVLRVTEINESELQ